MEKEKKLKYHSLTHSSESASRIQNEKNKIGIASQDKKTEVTRNSFANSLKTDTAVFYVGHSRYGSGPDFGPPSALNLIRKNNLELFQSSLSTSQNKPKIVGLFSCDSAYYYGKLLNKAAPDTSLILTNQTTDVLDSVPLVLASLDSIVSMSCEDAFHGKLKKATSKFFIHPDVVKTNAERFPEISGFFKAHREFIEPKLVSPYLFGEEKIQYVSP